MWHLRFHPRSADMESVSFYEILQWFVSTLKFENCCSWKQNQRQGLKFWLYLRMQAQENMNKGKQGSQVREAVKQWNTVLAATSKWIWKGHSLSVSRWVYSACGATPVCKGDAHLSPSWLLLSADWGSYQWGLPPLHFCITVSKSESGGMGADQEREEEGNQ